MNRIDFAISIEHTVRPFFGARAFRFNCADDGTKCRYCVSSGNPQAILFFLYSRQSLRVYAPVIAPFIGDFAKISVNHGHGHWLRA